ncbi:MAG: 4Fe-4S dicluster domain-containing protein [Deltaproteobacteria bacterium]|nr:4Fe-4S dicluster domain-containing protein [Deltaproteobacteria bacterium]
MDKQKQYRFLARPAFKALVKGLMKGHKVYGTVKKDGLPAWSEISEFEDLILFQTPAHLSAKEFLFPPRETLLKFDITNNTCEAVVVAEDQAIIGLHSCDIHGLSLMDRVFSYGAPDPNYLEKRKRTVIIGTDCFPDAYCFCASVGTMDVEEGFDLFLHEVKSGFLVRVGTERGGKLLRKFTNTRAASAKEVKELQEQRSKKESSFVTTLDAPAEDLPGIYAKSNDSPVWDKTGSICYGCGSCNTVCPTCYCFDIKDEVKADLTTGERVRVWDGCTLEDFALVAGGHNFRKGRSERLKHRFNRKFRYLSDRFSALFCVGCGRCSRTCLVKINIAGVTNELIRESREK